MQVPVTNVKEYVIQMRQKGYTDSQIKNYLLSVNWPEDVVNQAMQNANQVIWPNAEPQQIQQPQTVPVQQDTSQQQPSPAEPEHKPDDDSSQVPDDLFTKPPAEITGEEPTKPSPVKPKKHFSLWALVALLFSPIPFIGLGIAMHALESIKKNKNSGSIIAILALLINIGVIFVVLWAIYQIFTLDAGQLTGLSQYLNEKFNLV